MSRASRRQVLSFGPSCPVRSIAMKLNQLLQQRASLLQQTRLANVAFMYAELGRFVGRIVRGNLRGQVTLYLADPSAQRAWPILVADEGSQAVLEEHFLDKDILDLADLLMFTAGNEPRASFTFRLEEFGSRFGLALRHELEAAGVELTDGAELPQDKTRE